MDGGIASTLRDERERIGCPLRYRTPDSEGQSSIVWFSEMLQQRLTYTWTVSTLGFHDTEIYLDLGPEKTGCVAREGKMPLPCRLPW